jgi:hypothetical protein
VILGEAEIDQRAMPGVSEGHLGVFGFRSPIPALPLCPLPSAERRVVYA